MSYIAIVTHDGVIIVPMLCIILNGLWPLHLRASEPPNTVVSGTGVSATTALKRKRMEMHRKISEIVVKVPVNKELGKIRGGIVGNLRCNLVIY